MYHYLVLVILINENRNCVSNRIAANVLVKSVCFWFCVILCNVKCLMLLEIPHYYHYCH